MRPSVWMRAPPSSFLARLRDCVAVCAPQRALMCRSLEGRAAPAIGVCAAGSCHSSALVFSRRFHGNGGDRSAPLQVQFTLPDGVTTRDVTAYEGQTLLDVAEEHKLPMEGACAGSCACSTCHVYLEDDDAMDTFPEPSDEENDMIDQAFFPQPNSRLGCQLRLYKSKHNGLRVKMPKATRNMYVDGCTPTPH